MDLQATRAAVAELLDELPAQIHDMLEHVVCQVMLTPPAAEPHDTRGMFYGFQQVGGPDAPLDELELAHGVIQIYSCNLANAEQVQQTTLHEIGHALGFSEWDVFELGLAA